MLKPEEIKRIMQDDRTSERKAYARKSERYYESDHDIRSYRVMYVDGDGEIKEDRMRSNIRIPHPFFTEIVDQKAQYLLSDARQIIRSDDKALQEGLDGYFGDDFMDELNELVTFSSVHGWGYLCAYMGEEMRTKFQFVGALNVAEADERNASDGQPHVICWHIERIGKNHKILKIQDWDKERVTYYVSRDRDGGIGKLELDESEPINPRPHIVLTDGKRLYEDVYGIIPFFRLDNSRKQHSDLKPIKDLIDDYDLMACGLSNNLQDVAEGIYVVKGWEGDDLSSLITNIRAKKAISVPEGGDLDVRTINVPYEARKEKLELDEKNIYRFGMAFNAAQVGDGNITNVVIRSRYALLDLKCNKAETRLRALLWRLIDLVLEEINEREGTGWARKDVKIVLERSIITNQLDEEQAELIKRQTKQTEMNTLLAAAARLDDETVARSICKILEVEYDEIKGRLPEDPFDITQAAKKLEE